jgi:hypothetical protein
MKMAELQDAEGDIGYLLDCDPSALQGRIEFLGWRVRPLTYPCPFMEYARIHSPPAAFVDFGGSTANGPKIAARLKEGSLSMSVIISLRTRQGPARRVLPGSEVITMNAEKYAKPQPDWRSRDHVS